HGAGVMVFYDGASTWETVHRQLQQDLFGFGGRPDDAYAAGAMGFLMHFDGVSWSQERVPTDNWFRSVLHGVDGTFYIVGDGGAVLRYGRRSDAHGSTDPGLVASDGIQVAFS